MFPRKFSRKILFLSHFLPVFLQFCNRPVHILQAFSCKNACFPVFPVKIIQSCSSFTGLLLFTGTLPVFPVYRPVYRFIFVPKCKTGIQDRVQKTGNRTCYRFLDRSEFRGQLRHFLRHANKKQLNIDGQLRFQLIFLSNFDRASRFN